MVTFFRVFSFEAMPFETTYIRSHKSAVMGITTTIDTTWRHFVREHFADGGSPYQPKSGRNISRTLSRIKERFCVSLDYQSRNNRIEYAKEEV
uniref:Uncharacterized protein n=1 Tax=Romanomermis culicivorax TaxID=13658 RepID=A0A915L074_ROMCU